MKKTDYILIVILAIEMLVTWLFRNSLSVGAAGILTTLIPMIILPIIGGRYIARISDKFSFFNTLVVAAISTLIVLTYSMLFPWKTMLEGQSSNINFSPNMSSVISTLITEFGLTLLVYFVARKKKTN